MNIDLLIQVGLALQVVGLALVANYYRLRARCYADLAERRLARSMEWRARSAKLERRLVMSNNAAKELRIAVESVAKAVETVQTTGAMSAWRDLKADHEGD